MTQGRTFRAPWILRACRPNQISIYAIAKPIWIAPRLCLAADIRAGTLCVIGKSCTIEIETGDLARVFRVGSLWTSRTKEVNGIIQGHID